MLVRGSVGRARISGVAQAVAALMDLPVPVVAVPVATTGGHGPCPRPAHLQLKAVSVPVNAQFRDFQVRP